VPLVDHFLAEPLDRLPARRAGSIRRTSHVDMIGLSDGTLALRGAAVDPGGAASCRALVGTGRQLLAIEMEPAVPGGDRLLGRVVGKGFRAAVDQLCQPGTLPSVLLSELPVAALLSGYASLYTGEFPSPIPDAVLAGFPVDICAGWAAPASFMVQIRTEREMPTPKGPPAPDLGDGWHPMPTLSPGSMRRQRLIERAGRDVWAMFRDTYAQLDGVVTVLHEYTVEATLDGGGDGDGERVVRCVSVPRVLPWAECPTAAGSAGRVVGRRVADLRSMVRDEMVGTTTCTHLNDLLSSLSQAGRLVESPDPGRAR
jgi:hypothetical protein